MLLHLLQCIPLAEMFGYATELRSRTQGRGTYVPMEPSHYEVMQNQFLKFYSR